MKVGDAQAPDNSREPTEGIDDEPVTLYESQDLRERQPFPVTVFRERVLELLEPEPSLGVVRPGI